MNHFRHNQSVWSKHCLLLNAPWRKNQQQVEVPVQPRTWKIGVNAPKLTGWCCSLSSSPMRCSMRAISAGVMSSAMRSCWWRVLQQRVTISIKLINQSEFLHRQKRVQIHSKTSALQCFRCKIFQIPTEIMQIPTEIMLLTLRGEKHSVEQLRISLFANEIVYLRCKWCRTALASSCESGHVTDAPKN